MAPRSPPIASPHDLGGYADGRVVRAGGRVRTCQGTTIVLTDALAELTVTLREPAPLEPGELVVLEGRMQGSLVVDAVVLERHAGRSGGPETTHLTEEQRGHRLAARSHARRVIRQYFEREGFIEVETPVRVQSPGLDAHVDAYRAEGGWLVTSPELHMKRLLAGGMPRTYQLCRVSRRGEQGALHEPEFTLLEWYRAFATMEDTLSDTEAVVCLVAEALAPLAASPMRPEDLTRPFERLSIREAFREYAGVADAVDLAATDADRYFQTYVDHVEPGLGRRREPVFLVDYPATEGALARRKPSDPTVVERYELFIRGIELCNGYGELTDPKEQRRRFAAERARRKRSNGRAQPGDPRFLSALEEGLPPCSGNALGLDRLVAVALGLASIGPVIAFPGEAP